MNRGRADLGLWWALPLFLAIVLGMWGSYERGVRDGSRPPAQTVTVTIPSEGGNTCQRQP